MMNFIRNLFFVVMMVMFGLAGVGWIVFNFMIGWNVLKYVFLFAIGG